ncbi:Tf2-8, partial [Mucuna pruriens]
MAEVLLDEYLFTIMNNVPSPNSNAIPMREDPSSMDEPVEDEDAKAEALAEMEKQIEQKRPKFQPLAKELESINLGNEIEKREVQVGKQMPPKLRTKLVELLQEYADVFAWSYLDMPGLDCEIVEYKLSMLPNSITIRQQLRRMKPDVALKIKEEVEKQWSAGFLAVSNYPQWVANIVPIPKKGEKVHMIQPNPDGIGGLREDDLHPLMGNFLLQVQDPEQHIEDLRKLFTRLRKYRLRLNPAKCTFGVKTGKLLGFVVNERGIEVDPDKVKAIREMLTPKTDSEVRGFLGSVHFPIDSHVQPNLQTSPQEAKA